jgi:hypothetical protein
VVKPDIPSVHDILRKHRALAVHFSSVPRLDNTKSYFPDDLRYALGNPNMPGGLCCSVVRPGDTEENTFGTVGLIFDLGTNESLIAVSPGDGGAILSRDGVRDFDPKYKDFDLAAVDASICRRDSSSHNEWGIKDYLVRGLFVLPGTITVCAPSDRLRNVPLAELYNLFPGQRIYSFEGNGIVEIHPRSGAVRVDHREIYR